MIDLFKKLIPLKGFIWSILSGSFFEKLLEALAEEPIRIRDYLRTIVRESNPGTAIDTQEDWYQQYSIEFDPTKSVSDQQAETLERFIALGDQDIVYLQDQVTKAGFTLVTVIENTLPFGGATNNCGVAQCGVAQCGNGGGLGADWIFYFYVIGEVTDDSELNRLKTLIQRLSPGHCIPIYQIVSSDNVCGPAECNEVVCDG